jgi:hypothetical protein
MGATPVYALSWPNPPDPADGPAAFQDLAQDTEAALLANAKGAPLAVVTSLPGSPTDGQVVYYQNTAMATVGVVWQLRYRSAAAGSYKWEFIGGAPLDAAIATQQLTTSATYADLATPGPSVTVPLAGDYDVQLEAAIQCPGGTTDVMMSYQIGATAAVDADHVHWYKIDASQAECNVAREMRKTALAAGTVLLCKYRRTVAGDGYFKDRRISIRPVRVG